MREWQSRVGEEIVSPPHRPHPNPLPAGEGTDSARFPESRSARRADPTRGWSLVTLSIATSVDALAVGFSMAALGVSVWRPSVVIGFVAGGLTLVGLSFGRRLGSRWGRRAEAAGGCVLLAIGAKILITHLSGA